MIKILCEACRSTIKLITSCILTTQSDSLIVHNLMHIPAAQSSHIINQEYLLCDNNTFRTWCMWINWINIRSAIRNSSEQIDTMTKPNQTTIIIKYNYPWPVLSTICLIPIIISFENASPSNEIQTVIIKM